MFIQKEEYKKNTGEELQTLIRSIEEEYALFARLEMHTEQVVLYQLIRFRVCLVDEYFELPFRGMPFESEAEILIYRDGVIPCPLPIFYQMIVEMIDCLEKGISQIDDGLPF